MAEGKPNLRSPLVQSEPVAEGVPHLRSPLVQSEPVAEGDHPNLRASLVQSEPLAEGVPHLRAALVFAEALVDVPEELPVATAIFPTLRGLTWDIKKNPEFKTAARQVASGRETRTAFMQYPVWNFELAYAYLPDITPGSSGYTDLRTLEGFFLQMQGSFQAFLFHDKDDFQVTAGHIATGDGVTLQFPFVRDFGGFLEPVGQLDQTQAINVYVNGVLKTAGTDYTILMPNQLVFPVAPASGAVITANFQFYFVCRFTDDTTEFNQFMSKLWDLQKLDFRSVIQ